MFRKILFIFIFLLIPFYSFACTTELECLQDIKTSTTDLNTYFGVTSEPITMLDVEDFNQNISDTIKVVGVFMGLSLFASSFSFASYFYKR